MIDNTGLPAASRTTSTSSGREFWTGGITNPLTVIEQISFLMFSRLLDIAETTAEKREPPG